MQPKTGVKMGMNFTRHNTINGGLIMIEVMKGQRSIGVIVFLLVTLLVIYSGAFIQYRKDSNAIITQQI